METDVMHEIKFPNDENFVFEINIPWQYLQKKSQ